MNLKAAAGIALLPLLMALVWFISHPRPSDSISVSQSATTTEEQPTFSQTGNLVQNNPGLKPNVWYLIYDNPGAPGISTPLLFNTSSRCGSENMLEQCNISFDQGQRATITGWIEGDMVRVKTLIYR